MFNVKLFSVNKFFISKKFILSRLKILLKKNILKSKIKKNNIKLKIKVIINNKSLILIENLNISFDAIDVIYINKINIPPKKIKNNEYENQKVFVKIPVNNAIKIVWVINNNPIDSGWFIKEKVSEEIIKIKIKKFCIMSDQKIVYLKY